MDTTSEPLLDLLDEVRSWIEGSEGMGIGSGSIDFSIRHHFRDRLLTALLADIEVPEPTEEELARLRDARLRAREHARLTARLTVLAGALERIHAIANVSGDMGNPNSAIAKIEAIARETTEAAMLRKS